MIDSINSQLSPQEILAQALKSSNAAQGAHPRETKRNTLGKDDFLKIMMTQMKNQDPTNPFKAEQMAAEMAQFTSVEQLQNVNQNLLSLGAQQKPMEKLGLMAMIGKKVTLDRSFLNHQQGGSERLSVFLPENAEQLNVSLVNDRGEVVFEKSLGRQTKGNVQFDWDGKKPDTLPAASGSYLIKIQAMGEHQKPITIQPEASATIIGLSLTDAEPLFLVQNGMQQEKVNLKNIRKVEMSGDGSIESVKPVEKENKPAVFQFIKGQGSLPIQDSSMLPLKKSSNSESLSEIEMSSS